MILGNERDRKQGLVISVDFSSQTPRQKDAVQDELDQVMLANRRNQERMHKQRAATNKSVLRSYRINKNDKK